MKLIKFSITNFRSITKAHQIYISDLTTLVGKNNEGKSNILKALNLAMITLQDQIPTKMRKFQNPSRFRLRREWSYVWERDFPIAFQNRKAGTQSILVLEFGLNEKETKEFTDQIGSTINGTLPITLKFGKDNQISFVVSKQGKGTKSLSTKSVEISKFIAERLNFIYIPAIRTDSEAISIISEMVSNELRVLEENSKYIKALDTIAELQKPILDKLANKIKDPLSQFLPNIKNVQLEISENNRLSAIRRDIDVIIDDGFPTSIEYKGEGVKSLATLALLRDKFLFEGASIVAIEEPESHLHPSAIHQLKEIILDLSKSNQIIVSTHNPVFVQREDIGSNVIIDNRLAKTAKSMQEVRDVLGVQASDNLINSNIVIVVEGTEDKASLQAIINYKNPLLRRLISTNYLAFETLDGASNLSYKLSLLTNALCKYYVLLDNDDEGKAAFEKAREKGLIAIRNCSFTSCLGMPQSEFEDWLDVNIYNDVVQKEFGVNLSVPSFRNSNAKWSERMKKTFENQGKKWDERTKMEVKATVSECVQSNPDKAIFPIKEEPFNMFVSGLVDLSIKK